MWCLPPRLGRGSAKNPAQNYMEWMHLKGFIGAGALFSVLGWALGVLGVFGYVAYNASSALNFCFYKFECLGGVKEDVY